MTAFSGSYKRLPAMEFFKSVGGAVKSAFTSSGIETPAYEAAEGPHKEIEKRNYPDTVWVTTKEMGMTHKEAASKGFWKLFNYIQGKNEAKMKIPMTAPVAIKVEPGAGPNCESTFTVSFYIDDAHRANPPQPTEEGVYIDTWKPFTAYTRTYPGFANEETWIQNAATLAEQMGTSAKYTQEYYYTAGYDSPFKLMNRRNEVWFIGDSEDTKKTEQ